jgi:hypothetical protein
VRKEDVEEICKRIPEVDHAKIQFILRTGLQLNVDVFVRFEPTYCIFRGREGGNVDEGRAFFMPYDDVVTIKIERIVKLSELKRMCGIDGGVDEDEKFMLNATAHEKAKEKAKITTPAITPAPADPLDPAQIAKQNLLARIRAARTAAGAGAGSGTNN